MKLARVVTWDAQSMRFRYADNQDPEAQRWVLGQLLAQYDQSEAALRRVEDRITQEVESSPDLFVPEAVKLLVHRRGRRAGLGTRLMLTIEDAAQHAGFSLLTLDAKRGSTAEHLYRQLGWTHAGTIPGFAFDPDGTTPHDAIIFYKELNHADESRAG